MAYCNKCGAYIPDGQSACLACGFDPEAERQRAAQAQAQAAAYAEQAASAAEREADIRAEVERRRAERQENDRVWAENERRRRQMEEEFRRAQEEKEKRAESYVHRDGRRVNVNAGDVSVDVDKENKRVSVDIGGRRYTFGSGTATETNADGETRDLGDEIRRSASKAGNKGMAVLSYLGILVLIPLLFGQEDEFVKFHAKQGFKLFVCSAVGSALLSILGGGWLVVLAGLVLSVLGIINAVNGEKKKLPLLDKIHFLD